MGGPHPPGLSFQQMMLRSLVFLALLVAPVAWARDAAEMRFARQVLESLQARSFEANREYCGIIGITEDNRLVASKPRRGRRDSCRPRDPRSAVEIFASFHTHGGFDERADSEVPSSVDVQGDMEDGIDGYVSTPGGRLWFVDGQAAVVWQICGVGCLSQDPDFRPGLYGPVYEFYTLDELLERESQ
ncbi:MAG: DUF4329 domain-containing protein [Pseudomonadota bacterium]